MEIFVIRTCVRARSASWVFRNIWTLAFEWFSCAIISDNVIWVLEVIFSWQQRKWFDWNSRFALEHHARHIIQIERTIVSARTSGWGRKSWWPSSFNRQYGCIDVSFGGNGERTKFSSAKTSQETRQNDWNTVLDTSLRVLGVCCRHNLSQCLSSPIHTCESENTDWHTVRASRRKQFTEALISGRPSKYSFAGDRSSTNGDTKSDISSFARVFVSVQLVSFLFVQDRMPHEHVPQLLCPLHFRDSG